MNKQKQINKIQKTIDTLQKQINKLQEPQPAPKICCCSDAESILREYLPGLAVRKDPFHEGYFCIIAEHRLTKHLSDYDKMITYLECVDKETMWVNLLRECSGWKTNLTNQGSLYEMKGDNSKKCLKIYLEHFLVHCKTPKIPLIAPDCGCRKN